MRDTENYADSVMMSLRHGAWTEAAMLGTGEAAEQAADRYRTLVRLLDEATRTAPFPDRDRDTLRNYARWVLISLRTLADSETVPSISGGSAQRPMLGLADHMPAWLPYPIPPGWDDIAEADPPVRRSSAGTNGTSTTAESGRQWPLPTWVSSTTQRARPLGRLAREHRCRSRLGHRLFRRTSGCLPGSCRTPMTRLRTGP